MLLLAAVTSMVLAAPSNPGAAFGGKLPFPAPYAMQVTDATKCDFGTVLSVDAHHGKMQGTTHAGVVNYIVGPDVQVFSKDGKPVGGVAAVRVGSRYRAYYLLDGGARVQEIDLE